MTHTILLIEDDPLSARLADLLLKSEGYQVTIAKNGLIGLKIAHETLPDLILLDLMLPGLDGFEVLNRLRADPQTADVRVVIVSSKAQPTDRATALKIGANDYLTKPYRKNHLLEVVRSLLNEKREKTAARGICVFLLGPRGDEATPVTLYVGLALAGKGETTTVVDLRPFSVEHAMLLDMSPRPASASLSDPETVRQLMSLAVRHPGGLRLLNNLEGSGAAGQFTPEDASAALDVLLADGGFVLVDLPLYPADVLSGVAGRCAQVLLVVRGDAASVAAARSALTLMERAGVESERIGVVLVGSTAEGGVAELAQEVVGTVPAEAGADDPAFQALADHLLGLRQTPT